PIPMSPEPGCVIHAHISEKDSDTGHMGALQAAHQRPRRSRPARPERATVGRRVGEGELRARQADAAQRLLRAAAAADLPAPPPQPVPRTPPRAPRAPRPPPPWRYDHLPGRRPPRRGLAPMALHAARATRRDERLRARHPPTAPRAPDSERAREASLRQRNT